jgi:dipeptidyl aminopeptidase/acylaminoacyl peptidase
MLSCNTFAIKPDSVYDISPTFYGLMYKTYDIPTKDSLFLKAWFIPAQKSISKDSITAFRKSKKKRHYFELNSSDNPTIIMANGDASNMCQLIHYVNILSTNGFNVVTFDWRGFGESSKWSYEKGLVVSEFFVFDYNAVVDFVVKMPEIDSNRIGVYGFSTGAYISFIISSMRPEISAIAGRAFFTSYPALVSNIAKIEPSKQILLNSHFDIKYNALKLASNIFQPIFFIVGADDKRTPPSMSKDLLVAVNSNVRELWIVDNCGHGGAVAPEYHNRQEYFKRLIRFYSENLR